MAINTLLTSELTSFLDYEKYDRIGFNSGNSRNGSYSRTLHTESWDLQISISRDRNGEFKQQTIAPYRRSNDTLEAFVIHMFQKGVTTAEIANLIKRMYGHHYTPQTISNMTKVMTEQVEAFQARTLSARYTCVYLDGTEEILLFVSDGLKGITDAILSIYPEAKYQTCCVHLQRNIAHKSVYQIAKKSVMISKQFIVQKTLKWHKKHSKIS